MHAAKREPIMAASHVNQAGGRAITAWTGLPDTAFSAGMRLGCVDGADCILSSYAAGA